MSVHLQVLANVIIGQPEGAEVSTELARIGWGTNDLYAFVSSTKWLSASSFVWFSESFILSGWLQGPVVSEATREVAGVDQQFERHPPVVLLDLLLRSALLPSHRQHTPTTESGAQCTYRSDPKDLERIIGQSVLLNQARPLDHEREQQPSQSQQNEPGRTLASASSLVTPRGGCDLLGRHTRTAPPRLPDLGRLCVPATAWVRYTRS
jgi:hypothetical protein